MTTKPAISRRGMVAALGVVATGLAGCTTTGMPGTGSAGPTDSSVSHPTAVTDPIKDATAASEGIEEHSPSVAERTLSQMTLEEKVAQLFFVTPEGLTGVGTATVAGTMTKDALARIPVGGIIYFGKNLQSNQQVRDLLSGTYAFAQAAGAGVPPFLGVDEEGGPLVARVANSGLFDVTHFPNMAEIGATGDPDQAAYVGTTIGTYLKDIGFNVNFAPDADVLTNPQNTAIGARSFSSDGAVAASMVAAEVEAMLATGVLPCVKHFPGHGDTAGDSHTGAVYATRTREQIESVEFAPFRAAIETGCPFVMVGHIETPNFAADGLPASLSPVMMTDVLRGQLGFTGVIVSDSFAMGAITQRYTPADAAVRFFQAGGDMLLMPQNLAAAYTGVLDAVRAGMLTAERLDESVLRVLAAKEQAGLIG